LTSNKGFEEWGGGPIFPRIGFHLSLSVSRPSIRSRLSQSAAYVRDVLGARSAVDSAVPLPTPADKGINVDRLSLIVVGLGTALAGLSGVVAGPLLTLSPTMGSYILIDSFIVVVIGGLGSFAGAFVAALLIGQIHNFGAIYLPWAATILPFLLMVAILIWRPTGLAGSRA